jgi:hypothetical protein
MSARRATPRSGTPIQADPPDSGDSVVHQLRHRTWSPKQAPEERPAASRTEPPAWRRSANFTLPLRESFFDLAQRYHRLRESAFMSKAPRQKKATTMIPPAGPVPREPRLTDLPPPRTDDSVSKPAYLDSYIEENTEEATLVQPLARRASDPPPASEQRRLATVRPPPPPDPLPRIVPNTTLTQRVVAPSTMIPSSMLPPPVATATLPPPPPGPPPSIWRPMLATAVLSATIGAVVSVGLWAVRTSPPAPPLRPTIIATAATAKDATAASAPCPIPASYANGSSTSGGSSRAAGATTPVSLDNLPVEGSSQRGQSSALLRAPAPRAAMVSHAAPRSVAAAPAARASSDDEESSSTRSKRSRKAKAEKAAESESSSEADESLEARMAAPAPPPTPTAGPDKAAIAKAVNRAASSATSCDSGPQNGRAQITFAPSNNVANVSLIQPFSDNAVNGCVLRALGRAHVPPFTGNPVSVRKGLSW